MGDKGVGKRQQEGKGPFDFKRDLRNINTQEQYENIEYVNKTIAQAYAVALGKRDFWVVKFG